MPINVERFVPPEDIYHKIHSSICKRDNFKVGDRKVFYGTCNALHHKPRCLDQDEEFGKPITFPPVLDFCFGWHSK